MASFGNLSTTLLSIQELVRALAGHSVTGYNWVQREASPRCATIFVMRDCHFGGSDGSCFHTLSSGEFGSIVCRRHYDAGTG